MEKLLTELIELGKTKKFNGEIDYGSEIESDSIKAVQRFVAQDESSLEILKTFLEDAGHIHYTLLAITFASYRHQVETPVVDPEVDILNIDPMDFVETSPYLIKSSRAMRLLVNLIMRSPEFAAKMTSDSVELLETITATETSSLEIVCILTKTADACHFEFQKSPRYPHLLEKVLGLCKARFSFSQTNTEWIIAFFSTLLEKDYGFLSSCYAEMSAASFCALLDIVRVIAEGNAKSPAGQVLKMHSNNLLFVLNLLELITVDYNAFLTAKAAKEPKSAEERVKNTVEMLYMAVECVAEMCSNTEMTTYLNDKGTVVSAVVDVLDSILHAEALFASYRATQPEDWPVEPIDKLEEDDDELIFHSKFEEIVKKIEEEKRYESTQRKYADRPKQPPPSKIQRVVSTSSLAQLSVTVYQKYCTLEDDIARIGQLKLACIKAISNLCSLSKDNQLATLRNGRNGLMSVLQCTSRRPAYFMESCVMRNQAIFCVRLLTDNCQENKQVILNLGHPTQQIINRKRLLAEFGIDEEDVKGAELETEPKKAREESPVEDAS